MADYRNVMKTGLIVAAVVIVVRIVLEQLGAPETVNNVFGVAWLYLIFPVLFAWRIVARSEPRRYTALFKDVLSFAVYTRLMVMATYILAYFFRWSAPRFSAAMGGTVGENISLINGVVLIPLRNAALWVIMATVVGMIVGSLDLLLSRKKVAQTAPSGQ